MSSRRELLAMTHEGRAALAQEERQRQAPALFANTAVSGMTMRNLESTTAMGRHVKTQGDLDSVVRYIEQGGFPAHRIHDYWRVVRDVAAQKGLSAPPTPYHMIRNAAHQERRRVMALTAAQRAALEQLEHLSHMSNDGLMETILLWHLGFGAGAPVPPPHPGEPTTQERVCRG
jgi:hypothetical protein